MVCVVCAQKLYCFCLVQAWGAPGWSKTALAATGRASARGPDTRGGVPEGPLKACGVWRLLTVLEVGLWKRRPPAQPEAASPPAESGGRHLLDELHLRTQAAVLQEAERAPARAEARHKGRDCGSAPGLWRRAWRPGLHAPGLETASASARRGRGRPLRRFCVWERSRLASPRPADAHPGGGKRSPREWVREPGRVR